MTDDVDRAAFVVALATVSRLHGWRCHAYCLMDTHAHVVVETQEPNLGRGMQRLLSGYGHRFNRRHGREGHVFRRPYYSRRVIGEAHFLRSCVYVALNPVEAGLCDDASQWPASSYRETAFDHPGFVHIGTLLGLLDPDLASARLRYRRLVDGEANEIRRRRGGVSPPKLGGDTPGV